MNWAQIIGQAGETVQLQGGALCPYWTPCEPYHTWARYVELVHDWGMYVNRQNRQRKTRMNVLEHRMALMRFERMYD